MDIAEIDEVCADLVREQHVAKLRHSYPSMLSMEQGRRCRFCGFSVAECAGDDAQGCDCNNEGCDVCWVSPSCWPWSALGQTGDSKAPDTHKDFNVCFGCQDSANVVIRRRAPGIVLMEDVINFSIIEDSSGHTGLDRLVLEGSKITRGNKKRYMVDMQL